MSLAEDSLNFMFWQASTGISYKEQQLQRKRIKNIRKNEQADVGTTIRCAICGHKIKKHFPTQSICTKNRCRNRYNELKKMIR
jgi:hypothetical protein